MKKMSALSIFRWYYVDRRFEDVIIDWGKFVQ